VACCDRAVEIEPSWRYGGVEALAEVSNKFSFDGVLRPDPSTLPKVGRAAKHALFVPSMRMGRGPSPFKQSNVKRAVKAAKDAGLDIACVRFHKDGGFDVVVGKPAEDHSDNDVENWIDRHVHQS